MNTLPPLSASSSDVALPFWCLSVQEPWASAIVRGLKDVENRNWHRSPGLLAKARSLIGQRVAIQTSQTYDTYGYRAVRQLTGQQIPKADCTLGAVIGVVTLRAVDTWSPSRFYDEGQIALGVDSPVQIDVPVPQKGALGFFRLDPDVRERVLTQLRFQGVAL